MEREPTLNVGHRYKSGHPYYPPKRSLDGSAYERLVKKFIRKLKREYGPDLTAKQQEHINTAAHARARLTLRGEQMEDADFVLVSNAERRALESL
jgi:hypothetical protein